MKNPADEMRHDSKPTQPREGHQVSISDRDALADRHYDIDDINECFSSADLKRMDLLARSGEFAGLGKTWSALTAEFRAKALENAKYFLEEQEVIRFSEPPIHDEHGGGL